MQPMERSSVIDRLRAEYDSLSAQLQVAARYVLDNPQDVALMSMREQSKAAGVLPATMTRLAKHLGLSGYDDIRSAHIELVRRESGGFAPQARKQAKRQRHSGDFQLAQDIVQTQAEHLNRLRNGRTLPEIVAAADAVAKAEQVYCLGLRSSYPVAWHLHYILSLAGLRTTLLDASGGIGFDVIRSADEDSVLVAISVAPYTRATVDVAAFAGQHGAKIIAISDSAASPLARMAHQSVIVPTESPFFLHSMTPAFLAAETLAAIIAGHRGDEAATALEEADRHFEQFNTHLRPRNFS